MPMPTEANDREFWWVKSSDGLNVVQIYADSGTLNVWGEPTFFWCGNECEEKVSAQGLVWLGKVEPPKSEEGRDGRDSE